MADIFISYKRDEQLVAKELATQFESLGWSVWWDVKIKAGERFDDIILDALEESRCVIVIWSKLSVESSYVRDEASFARDRNKLVPIMIEEVNLPFRFDSIHTEHMYDWKRGKKSASFERLVSSIEKHVPKNTRKTQEKNYTTLIVDGIFLEQAISKTIRKYKNIYPDKVFTRPRLEEILINILKIYDNFKSKEKLIRCYVYYYEEDLDNNNHGNESNRFKTEDGTEGKIFIDITNDFVSFEIIDHLNRIINNENVILVADDVLYEGPLNTLKDKNIDVTLVMFKEADGGRMVTEHMWGDIVYPVATSLGLERYEW